MKIENANTRTGRFVLAPNSSFHTFEPNPLPIKIVYDDELVKLLADAKLSIGKLSMLGKRLRNPDLIIMPYLTKEAVISSRIEGTRTTLSDVLQEKEPKTPERRDDFHEVMNYEDALNEFIEELKNKNFSEDMIKQIHVRLMKSVRGESKHPGQYKISPNWIGDPGDDVLAARFVPSHPMSVESLMKNLVNYMNSEDEIAGILKAAMVHYQFESVHPFEDGNGRIGRLLIILLLCKKGVLPKPLLYLSAYFEKNKEEYENRLLKANTEGKIEEWLKFFLKAVKTQADDVLIRTNKLEEYYQDCSTILRNNTKSNKVLSVLDMLLENPYIRIPKIVKTLKCEWPTARHCVDILLKYGILHEKKNGRKRAFYAPRLVQILFSR